MKLRIHFNINRVNTHAYINFTAEEEGKKYEKKGDNVIRASKNALPINSIEYQWQICKLTQTIKEKIPVNSRQKKNYFAIKFNSTKCIYNTHSSNYSRRSLKR